MGDKKPKKNSSGTHDKHAAKHVKAPFTPPAEPPAKSKDKKK